ncbi:MAG: 2TM domain-containing protein [Pedobacter sp.]|nr:MAG: 2TM domain-containing protein [Pedobacter sp.]
MEIDIHRKIAKAEKRARQIKSFYTHLLAYVSINTALVIYYFADDYLAAQFWQTTFSITLGFGSLGVVSHAIAVYGQTIFFPKGWEQRKIKQLIEKNSNNKSNI